MKVLLGLILVAVLGIAGYVGYLAITSEKPTASYSVNAATHCEQATGRPSVCQITLTSRSTADFDWHARGEPDVVSSSPASGSLGADSSTTVTVTLPCLRQPVTVIFEDTRHSVSTRSTVPAVRFC